MIDDWISSIGWWYMDGNWGPAGLDGILRARTQGRAPRRDCQGLTHRPPERRGPETDRQAPTQHRGAPGPDAENIGRRPIRERRAPTHE